MKTTIRTIITILFLCFVSINDATAQQISPKIQEIYGGKMQEFAQNDPEHLVRLKDLIDNRIKIIESAAFAEEKYVKLSTIELLNKYNPDLKRDLTYDPITFNPLKYNLNFFSTKPEVYRIDNTDYLIVITPQSLNK
ncbi:MAG: hypothetical protein H7141_02190 [Burkholderiales bacterium]|nr:hypothetical protein [Bacteroidia bacterium]